MIGSNFELDHSQTFEIILEYESICVIPVDFDESTHKDLFAINKQGRGL